MSWRRYAGGGKRDAAERPIIEALQGLGCTVYQLSGKGNPDLLVRRPSPSGLWVPLEVKSDGGTLTKNQQDLEWPVVRDKYQAIQAVFG